MIKDKKKMRLWKKLVIILILIILIAVVGMQAMIFMVYNENFHVRYDTMNIKQLPDFSEYPHLDRARVDFKSDKGQNLVGYFYSKKNVTDYKAAVVFNHGFGGGGHRSYLPQIEYLAKNDYLVLGFDKTGNDESEGKYVKGMPQGVIDLKYALDFVRTHQISKDLPIMLYGHSWGGYSVCSVLEDEDDITAVAEFAGFNTSMDIIMEQGAQLMGGDISFMKPFLWFCDFFNFGFDAGYSSLEGLKKTNSKVILFHSDDDKMVSAENSFDLYEEKLDGKENLTFVRVGGRGHDLFLSEAAIRYSWEKNVEFKKLYEDNGGNITDEQYDNYMEGYNKKLAQKLDNEIMDTVIEFYDKALEDKK